MNAPNEPRPPMHGYRGSDSGFLPKGEPQGLTVALSREAGARGLSIAEALARQLGWEVYNQEVLNYLKPDDVQRLFDELGEPARDWVESHFQFMMNACHLNNDSELARVVRLLLVLAGKGSCVLIGQGAGLLLPPETTVRVRIVAPLQDRIAYLAESLRMTHKEAETEVHARDAQRAKHLQQLMPAIDASTTPHDMVLNSTTWGRDGCVAVLAHAVQRRQHDGGR